MQHTEKLKFQFYTYIRGCMLVYLPALSCERLPTDMNSDGWSCTYGIGKVKNPPFIYGTLCENNCKAGYIPARGTEATLECIIDRPPDVNKVRWSSKPLQCEGKFATEGT